MIHLLATQKAGSAAIYPPLRTLPPWHAARSGAAMIDLRSLGVVGLFALSVAAIGSLGCAAESASEGATDDDATEVSEDDLTSSAAKKLGVPLAVLDATFYFKPSPQDQSGLGVVLGDGVAFASGSGSQSLPAMTSLDRKPFARLLPATVDVGGELDGRFGAFFDYEALSDGEGERLLGRTAPPLFDVASMREGLSCRVLGAAFDMYASTAPKAMSLAGKVSEVRLEQRAGRAVAYQVVVKTTRSTGGDGSLLVCDGKLAGISAGAGSQGTYHEFRSVDAGLVAAFTDARAASLGECKRRNRCK